jgi:hypothetical protein
MSNVAAKTLELVDEEMRRMVREAEEIAKQIIKANAGLLDELANTLLETETLSGAALDVFLENVKPWPEQLVKTPNGNGPVRMRAAADNEDEDAGVGSSGATDFGPVDTA